MAMEMRARESVNMWDWYSVVFNGQLRRGKHKIQFIEVFPATPGAAGAAETRPGELGIARTLSIGRRRPAPPPLPRRAAGRENRPGARGSRLHGSARAEGG